MTTTPNSITIRANIRPGQYGNTDHKTSPSCFFAGDDWNHYHFTDFNNVVTEINRMAKQPFPVIDLIFFRADSAMLCIAFRFKSDYAYDMFSHALRSLTGSLGRGTFEPFKCGSDDCERFMLLPHCVSLPIATI